MQEIERELFESYQTSIEDLEAQLSVKSATTALTDPTESFYTFPIGDSSDDNDDTTILSVPSMMELFHAPEPEFETIVVPTRVAKKVRLGESRQPLLAWHQPSMSRNCFNSNALSMSMPHGKF